MKTRFIYILIIALSLTACQKTDVEYPYTPSRMVFNVLAPGVATKATDDVFEPSDVVGLFVTDYVDDMTPMPLQLSGNRASNIRLSFDGTSWATETDIYWGNGKSDVYAYYPYISDLNDVNSLDFTVCEDQDGHGFEQSDLLWTKVTGVSHSDGKINLSMKHMLSRLRVMIVAGEDYVGSLPTDAEILLHNTVPAAIVDFDNGSVKKNPYEGAKTIKLKNLGLKTVNGTKAVLYEAIVVPQMLQTTVPFLEIVSKNISYLLEESFNFRPGVSYAYTATLNTSTTSIKVDIGCEIEDWTSGDNVGDDVPGEDGRKPGDDENLQFVNLSSDGTANCYHISEAGDYKFKAVLGNSKTYVGNVKSVDVLWESFGTNVAPNVGDLIASASYRDGFIRFSTSEVFQNGNAVIAAKNSKGTILWSWHIWCSKEGWVDQEYFNNAGTMMDRNLGALSATPKDVGALGLLYQWGRKDPFLASSSISSDEMASSTLESWPQSVRPDSECGTITFTIKNPTVLIGSNGGNGDWLFFDHPWSDNTRWLSEKTVYDPCPAGYRIPEYDIWTKAMQVDEAHYSDSWTSKGADFGQDGNTDKKLGPASSIWYPCVGQLNSYALTYTGRAGHYWSYSAAAINWGPILYFFNERIWNAETSRSTACSVRCLKE